MFGHQKESGTSCRLSDAPSCAARSPALGKLLKCPQGSAPLGEGPCCPRRHRACLRVEGHLVPESLRGSSRCTDLGRGFLGFALELLSPCSSRICCCFLRKYSCLMSSRRAFSSSFRIRSSSAFRLRTQDSPGYRDPPGAARHSLLQDPVPLRSRRHAQQHTPCCPTTGYKHTVAAVGVETQGGDPPGRAQAQVG